MREGPRWLDVHSLETVVQEAPGSVFRPKQTPLLCQQDEGHAETVLILWLESGRELAFCPWC